MGGVAETNRLKHLTSLGVMAAKIVSLGPDPALPERAQVDLGVRNGLDGWYLTTPARTRSQRLRRAWLGLRGLTPPGSPVPSSDSGGLRPRLAGSQHAERAIDLLTLALREMPVQDRPTFWHQHVLEEASLAPALVAEQDAAAGTELQSAAIGSGQGRRPARRLDGPPVAASRRRSPRRCPRPSSGMY